MKAFKVLSNSEILTSTVLVMACLGYLPFYWFWICFVLSELNAYLWFKRMDKTTPTQGN